MIPAAAGKLDQGGAMYVLFEGNNQIGSSLPTEKRVWEAALIEGLVTDVPVANETGGQIPPEGYYVAQVEDEFDPRPDFESS